MKKINSKGVSQVQWGYLRPSQTAPLKNMFPKDTYHPDFDIYIVTLRIFFLAKDTPEDEHHPATHEESLNARVEVLDSDK